MDLKLLPNNAMIFTENQHGNAVLEKLRQQRELVRCCDVILHVDGKQFHAHRCVLSACSPFFDSLFKASKTVKEQLTISADSSEVFHILLAYMYTGTVIVDKKNVSELLKLANKLLLSKLKEYCAEYLQRYLDTRNCLTVLEMANKYCLESLQKTANSHITVHLMEIIEGEEILELSLLRLENFIKNPNWRLSNEEILMLITCWVYHKLKMREANFRSLLTWISWKDIDPERVIKVIQEHLLFSSSRKCRSFILEVLDESSFLHEPSYDKLTELKTRLDESGGTNEDSDKFLNLAISTAIGETLLNEPYVDRYLMDTGKDLLRGDFVSTEQTHFELRDLNQSKSINADFPQYSYVSNGQNIQGKNNFVDNVTFQPNSNYSQNFDIEELCKYTIENTQKQKQQLIEGSDDEQNNLLSKQSEYENSSYGDHPPNCYHYRDYRDTEHFSIQNSEKCPKMTNKVSYMNHKYDANYSTQLSSFSDLNYQKNGSSSTSEMSSATLQMDLNKENSFNSGGTYPNEHNVSVPFSQDSHCQSVFLLPANIHKKDQLTVSGNAACDSQEAIHNTLIESNTNLNSFSEFKSNSFTVSSAQSELIYMDCSDDTQGSNNSPRDMSFNHLKLSECSSSSALQSNKDKTYSYFGNDLQRANTPDIRDPHDEALGSSRTIRSACDSEDKNEHCEEYEAESRMRTESKEIKENELNMDSDNSDGTSPSSRPLLNQHNEINLSSNTSKIKDKSDIDEELPKKTQENKVKTRRKQNLRKTTTKKNTTRELKNCEICNTSFDRKKDYFAHMINHFPGPPHQCDTCSSTFKRIYYLLDHRHTHSEGKPFKCSQCSFTSRRMFNLKEHMTLHTNERPFKYKSDDIDEELPKKTQENKVKTGRKQNLRKITTKKNTTRELKNCEICNTSFDRKKDYFAHMIDHFPGPPHQCDTCSSTFKRIYYLLDHRHTHSEGKPFKCSQCSFTSRRMFNLKEHMTLHTNERPFKCEECGDSFSRKQHLVFHRTKHTNERPLICEKCGWSGKTKNSLLFHSKVHTGDLYSCQYPDCAYRTPKKSHLKEHMQYHTKSRPFICKVCPLTFISKSHLQRHLLKHESPNLHQCPYCDYCSSRLDSLKIHTERKHSATKPKLRLRRGQLKKKDALLANNFNNKKEIIPSFVSSEQTLFSNLNVNGGRLSPNSSLPPLSATLSHYPPPSSSPPCTFGTPGDPDDPLPIVSEMEDDNQSLSSFISHWVAPIWK